MASQESNRVSERILMLQLYDSDAFLVVDLCRRHGVSRETFYVVKRRPLDQGQIIAGADAPNEEWAIDFKGWFCTRNGTRCDPLTGSDTASRYLIDARIIHRAFPTRRAADL